MRNNKKGKERGQFVAKYVFVVKMAPCVAVLERILRTLYLILLFISNGVSLVIGHRSGDQCVHAGMNEQEQTR